MRGTLGTRPGTDSRGELAERGQDLRIAPARRGDCLDHAAVEHRMRVADEGDAVTLLAVRGEGAELGRLAVLGDLHRLQTVGVLDVGQEVVALQLEGAGVLLLVNGVRDVARGDEHRPCGAASLPGGWRASGPAGIPCGGTPPRGCGDARPAPRAGYSGLA